MTMRCPTCGAQYDGALTRCTRDGARLLPLLRPPAPRAKSPGARAPGRRTSPSSRPTVPTANAGGLKSPFEMPLPPNARTPLATTISLEGTLLDGRFRVGAKIAEGGMSHVFRATDESRSGVALAIKILSPSLARDRTSMARLRREAAFGARLAHPNVCHIVHVGETVDGLVYVVMPFIEGELLADRTYRAGHLPVAEAVTLAGDVAAGLDVAHRLGIVHRDLKPENVMVRPDPDRPRAVVMDFGLAKEPLAGSELEQLTASGVILGTPEFMSPEQLRGRTLDARTDVYSLALVTYEMLTGQLPFDGKSPQEVMIARLRGDPIPLRRRRPELAFSASLERVLQRALSREPEHRPASAPEFAAALAAAAAEGESPSVFGRLFSR
jgi:eukaryotic-like serine/threonine-protein kinase